MAFGDADRGVFLDSAVFGSTVVSGAETTTGVLRLQWFEEQDASGVPFRTQRPTLTVKRGALTRPSLDATVTVGGTAYVYRGKADGSDGSLRTTGGFETWLLAGGPSS